MRAVVESLGSELAQTAPTQSGVVLTELTRHIAPLLGETHPHLHPTSRVLFARSSHSRALASYRPERHREQMPREGSSSAAIFAKILGFRGPATPGWGV